jgi:hypothetical protein
MESSNDTIGNRTSELQACSTVPQPSAPQAACPIFSTDSRKNTEISNLIKIHAEGAEFFLAEGQTDRQTLHNQLSLFRNSATAPKTGVNIL